MNQFNKKRVLPFLLLILTPSLTFATQEKIPIEIVEALLSHTGKTHLQLGTANKKFPELNFDKKITLYGSSTASSFGHKSETNFYITRLSKTVLGEKIKQQLNANNWRVPHNYPGNFNNGFRVKNEKNIYKSLLPYCHEKFGNITLTISELKSGSFAKLSYSPHQKHSMRCNLPDVNQNPFLMTKEQLPMPELELPDQNITHDNEMTHNQALMGLSGSSSGRGERTTHTSISSKMSIGDIYQHFVPQLMQQGWSNDSNWLGATTAGGHWTTTKNDKHYLVGISIIKSSTNIISLKMWIKKQS
ncbi:hypothetical protein [Pseudoalteromonas denitrificans]|nr:hypothetical protein [Pseudoalteromonas denitrificans]